MHGTSLITLQIILSEHTGDHFKKPLKQAEYLHYSSIHSINANDDFKNLRELL